MKRGLVVEISRSGILALLLFGLACFRFHWISVASAEKAKSDIGELMSAIEHFHKDVGRYPSEQEGLQALLEAPSGAKGWNGPYLSRLPKDRWGHGYAYLASPEVGKSGVPWEIVDYGQDGRPGGRGLSADTSSMELYGPSER